MIPELMEAAVIEDLGQWPRPKRVAVPAPGPGQVLVRIEASGVCHTDVHTAAGETAVDEALPPMPIIPGHEGAGTVASVGEGVTLLDVGDRVVIGWLGGACGDCPECRSGNENLCRLQHNPGNSYDGTLAEYAVVWARSAARIPDGLSSTEAGPLGCAGVAAFGTVMRAGIAPGDTVSVIGIGGLGHLAVQYARLAGARVVAVDPDDRRLDLASDLGAELCVNPTQDDSVEAVVSGGVDAALVFAAAPEPLAASVRSLRRAGRMVVAGWPTEDPTPVPVGLVIERGLQVVGSDGGTLLDLERVLQLHALGSAGLEFEERGLHEVESVFRAVHEGELAKPRVVITGFSAG